jgi:hypothetical protein
MPFGPPDGTITARGRCLALLAQIAACAPGLRIGQIIGNATPVRFNNDPFYVSDEELACGLAEFLGKVRT